MTLLEALSILHARFPFNVCRNDISSELVAGYLSWCLYISPDRWLVTSTMPSEPIVAEAAALWMNHSNCQYQMYEHLISSITCCHYNRLNTAYLVTVCIARCRDDDINGFLVFFA